LSNYLFEGELALVLGSGVSKPFGFPFWWELVHGVVVEHYGESSIDEHTPADKLKEAIDEIERDIRSAKKYNELVKKVLYKNVNYRNTGAFVRNELLISLGALMMGSRRGSIKNVITYNYDDLLEWYLGLHGFDVGVIHDPRSLTSNSDVTIYHPHGFLPLQSREMSKNKIILSDTSFIDREKKAKPDDTLWNTILDRLFIEKVFIFIGISKNDASIQSRISHVYRNHLKKEHVVVFWFCIQDEEMGTSEIKNNTEHGIVPIVVKNAGLIPSYLLDICQNAMRQKRTMSRI
jgi:hypothetical protein